MYPKDNMFYWESTWQYNDTKQIGGWMWNEKKVHSSPGLDEKQEEPRDILVIERSRKKGPTDEKRRLT